MSRIPAQGVVVTVGTLSVVASLCLLGGGATAAGASTDTTTHPFSLAATTTAAAPAGFSGSAFGATAVTGVSSAEAMAATTNLYSLVTSSATSASVATAATTAVATPAATPPAAPVKVAAKPVVKAVAAPLTPRAIAQALAARRGWTGAQWVCLDDLWQHESKYLPQARNSRSGAYGIPQALPASKMAAAGADWRTNPTTQVTWGLNYIGVRYGTPCGAWSHEERHGSY
jgi:hypothetical protein